MNARDLVELAATIVEAAGEILRGRDHVISEASLHAYWDASRMRQEDWAAAFKSHGVQLGQLPPGHSREAWRPLRPVVEEILLSEPLTRVVAAMLAQWDQESSKTVPPLREESGSNHWLHFVHVPFLGHLEARRRALNLMVFGQRFSFSQREGVVLNRLRRRCEYWSDLLLAALPSSCDISPYAVDLRRAQRMTQDLGLLRADVTQAPSWPWIRAAMRSSLWEGSAPGSASFSWSRPNGGRHSLHNRKIGASVLSWLRATSFDSWEVPRSSWMARLMEAADEVRLEPDHEPTPWGAPWQGLFGSPWKGAWLGLPEGKSASPKSPRLPLDRFHPDSRQPGLD